MPTRPSRKGRAARKGTSATVANVNEPTVIDSFLDQIDSAPSLEAAMPILGRLFGIPGTLTLHVCTKLSRLQCCLDLNTRSGLKKVHVIFWDLQRKLEAVFDKYRTNEKVAYGIIAVWNSMTEDDILQEKLITAGTCSQ